MTDELEELDYQLLDKLLDRTKAKTFIAKNGAFLGSLMCSLNFMWTEDHRTAKTNGYWIQWNPRWFLKLPEATRSTVLMHELWHVGLLHPVRFFELSSKYPYDVLNRAADYIINGWLDDLGFSFEGTTPCLDHQYDNMNLEEVCEILHQMNIEELNDLLSQGIWGPDSDLTDVFEDEDNPVDLHKMLNMVVQASTQAQLAGEATDLPGEVETTLKRFLQPKLPWEQLVYMWMNELSELDYRMNRPNRRYLALYEDMYLPSLQPDNGLDHIILYEDVSGSVTDSMIIRFNSEFKYLKETFNPVKITLVLFDTIIQKEIVFTQEDDFDELVVVGRGGTFIAPVRQHIIDNKPTAVIIFSDMDFHDGKMEKLPFEVPIIWVAVNGYDDVNQGKIIRIVE